jgi:phospholipid/cholesterol/gamma-HCH transport system ATP-binding protein
VEARARGRRWGILFQQGRVRRHRRQNAVPDARNPQTRPALDSLPAPSSKWSLTDDDGDKLPAELSGGMTARQAARALALDPRSYFDEPTSGLTRRRRGLRML